MKQAVRFLLSLVLVVAFVPAAAFADDYTEGVFCYTVSDESVTITGCFGRGEIVRIDTPIGGCPVNTIAAGAFSSSKYIKKVVLPDTIQTIEDGAFAAGIEVYQAGIEVVPFGGSYSLVKYVPSYSPNNNVNTDSWTYGGAAMYSKDVAFYCVVSNGATADKAKAKFDATGSGIAYDAVAKGDINGSGAINVVDAQIAFDIATGAYSGFDVLTASQVVTADANEDLAIDATDARAIQVCSLTGSFSE